MQWDNKNMKNNSGRAGTFDFVLAYKKSPLGDGHTNPRKSA